MSRDGTQVTRGDRQKKRPEMQRQDSRYSDVGRIRLEMINGVKNTVQGPWWTGRKSDRDTRATDLTAMQQGRLLIKEVC